jgi:general L-amino acid transport system permease protein
MPKRLVAVFFLAVYPFITVILLSGGDIPVGASWWIALTVVAVVVEVLIFLPVALGESLTGERIRSGLSALVPIGYVALVYIALAADYGLETVQTDVWGGLLITLVAAITGIVASMPIGILLALGRRSELPVIRLLSVGFIEVWRGVPLITVLFFASVMLPLFIPGQINKLLAALIGIVMFSSAYIAEVVRGGLQAIPKGQYEAADAVGLSHWQKMRLIVLPQALKHVIPGIMNSFIALFKDTSLVSIVALFDLLGQLRASFSDPVWSTPSTLFTGFAFTGMIYFVFCFGMSRYSLFVENRLNAHQRN